MNEACDGRIPLPGVLRLQGCEHGPAQLSRYDGDMKLELSAINEDGGKYLVLNSKFSTSTQKE
jgi:hypothetical protein